MRNFWIVAWHEYRNRVAKRSFLLGTLIIPLMIIAIMGVAILVAVGSSKDQVVGYVDHSGLLAPGILPLVDGKPLPLKVVAYADEAAARSALEKQDIQAYYVLPKGFLQSRQIDLFYWDKAPNASIQSDFSDFVRANLAAGLPAVTQQRLVEGPKMSIRSMDGSRQIGPGDVLSFILPFASGFLFFMIVMSSAGYLLQVVTDEKENRTIEILVTSLSPEQLIGGKAIGLMAVSLTQMSVWLLAIITGVLVARPYLEPLQNIRMPWDMLLVDLLFFLPAFCLITGVMTAIGGAVTDTQQGQQIAGVVNLVFILPFLFSALIFFNPNSPFMVFLTLFPTTSFITISLRWGFSAIPFWQLAVSWILLVSTAVFSLWASARIFRFGMLRYGQRLSLKDMRNALKTGSKEVSHA